MIEVTFGADVVAGWYEEFKVFRDPRIIRGTTFENWIRNQKTKGRPFVLNCQFSSRGRVKDDIANRWIKITCLDDIDAMKMRLSW